MTFDVNFDFLSLNRKNHDFSHFWSFTVHICEEFLKLHWENLRSFWVDGFHLWKQPDQVENDEVKDSNQSILNWVYFHIFLVIKIEGISFHPKEFSLNQLNKFSFSRSCNCECNSWNNGLCFWVHCIDYTEIYKYCPPAAVCV